MHKRSVYMLKDIYASVSLIGICVVTKITFRVCLFLGIFCGRICLNVSCRGHRQTRISSLT